MAEKGQEGTSNDNLSNDLSPIKTTNLPSHAAYTQTPGPFR